MNILLVVGIGAALLFIASRTYPFWIARVFDQNDASPPPSERFADGREYVKTPTQIVFAHHFASIAGAGPIVGPILALAFGWGPAWLWIIFGGILYGAVHDMTAMFVSVREGGKTIAEIARRSLGTGGYLLFVLFLILVLCLINAIFLNLSARALTSLVPLDQLGITAQETVLRTFERDGVAMAQIGGIATTSVFIMTLLAPMLGFLVIKRGIRGVTALAIAATVCVASVIIGFMLPIRLSDDPVAAMNAWRWMLAAYVFAGCWIPVWLIIQPRDFTNVQVLYAGLILLVAGSAVAGFNGTVMSVETMSTPAEGVAARGSLWPFLFITIACGAISGFHSLVASGTTVKQIPRESDCRRVGDNAMLLESVLALLVLAAVASQLTRGEYMEIVNPPGGGGNAVLAFSLACGRTFASLGIPLDVGSVLGILIIEGFLVTTLDTAVRLCRYLLEELWSCLFAGRPPAVLRWRATNTILAVGGMLYFAFSSVYDQIWTIFGSGNQLIGALALTTVTIWLLQRRKSFWFTAIPAVCMVVTTMMALWSKMWVDLDNGNTPLAVAGMFLFGLAIGFVVIAVWKVRLAVKAAVEGVPSG
jgi:carbon starvation protein